MVILLLVVFPLIPRPKTYSVLPFDVSNIKITTKEEIVENTKEEVIEETKEEIQQDTKEETIEIEQPIVQPQPTPQPAPRSWFKSYMDWRNITSVTSNQYKLQQTAYTAANGLRMVDDCYCIAIGTGWGFGVGTKILVHLSTGVVLNCIVADIKADHETDANNIYHLLGDGSVIEFVIDKDILPERPKIMGDISHLSDEFKGDVLNITRR